MTDMDIHQAQILRQKIGRILRGERVTTAVGALEMVIVDVLASVHARDEATMLRAFNALASDVRNIIVERFAMQGRPN